MTDTALSYNDDSRARRMEERNLYERIQESFAECVMVHFRPFFKESWYSSPEFLKGSDKNFASVAFTDDDRVVFKIDGTKINNAWSVSNEIVSREAFDEFYDSVRQVCTLPSQAQIIKRFTAQMKDRASGLRVQTQPDGVFDSALPLMSPYVEIEGPLGEGILKTIRVLIRVGELKDLGRIQIREGKRIEASFETQRAIVDQINHRRNRMEARKRFQLERNLLG